MANRVTIIIAGQRYTMLADETEEYMNEVALLAQQTIAACGGSEAFASTRVLALSTVNLADELIKTKKQLQELQSRMDEACEQAALPAAPIEDTQQASAQGKTEQVLSLLKTGPRTEQEPSGAQTEETVAEKEQTDFEQVQSGDAPTPSPAVNAARVIESKKKHGGKPSHPAYRR